jgi:O-antigen ligase
MSERRVVWLPALPLCTLAWGALAFGAVYPWAYWPLAAACLLSGAAGLAATRAVQSEAAGKAFTFALVGLAAAIVLQLIPIPVGVVAEVSPRTVDLLGELNPAFAAGLMAQHPVSIWPRDTWTALALYGSLAVLLVGTTRLLSLTGTQRFVESLTIVGVVLALIGIVQNSVYDGAIYGLWKLEIGRMPFGPFVNRNHFAGWMVMALPLTLALLLAGIARGMRGVKPGWRYKVLWLSSPEASQLVLIAAASVVMALSLMLTMSRSGITAFGLSILISGWFVARALHSRSRQVIAVACLTLLLVGVVVWTGPEVIAGRFSDADWGEFNNRRGAWSDAWSVARDFPLAGTGLNTYWAAALFYQRHELAYFYAQAHSDYLQLAAEGGLLLTLPAFACLIVFVRDVHRAMGEQRGSTSWWLRAGAVTSLVAIACQETVEFSLQMPGNAALFAVVCAIALHRSPLPEGQLQDDVRPSESDPRQPHLRLVSPESTRTRRSRTSSAARAIVVVDYPRHG